DRFSAFHEPRFLAGVWLRIAEDEQVDQCLLEIQEKFQKLKEHFPSLDQSLVAESNWRNDSLDAKKERITRAQAAYEEIAPKFAKIEQDILNEILPEAFAVVKNASRRLSGREIIVCDQPLKWDMVHFDVQ